MSFHVVYTPLSCPRCRPCARDMYACVFLAIVLATAVHSWTQAKCPSSGPGLPCRTPTSKGPSPRHCPSCLATRDSLRCQGPPGKQDCVARELLHHRCHSIGGLCYVEWTGSCRHPLILLFSGAVVLVPGARGIRAWGVWQGSESTGLADKAKGGRC